jgi:colicin import membrane protein
MFRRAEVAGDVAGHEPGTSPPPERPDEPRRPNLSGDLEAMMSPAPVFRSSVLGYDRLEVDNYVAWAEAELRAGRRETDDLATRFGQASAELEICQRLLAHSPEGQELTRVSERIASMLQLAADEAADRVATGTAEAQRVLAEARAEADARLRQAHEIKEQAVATADRLHAEAQQERADAAATVDAAIGEATRILHDAAAERERLKQEAARARAQDAADAAQRLAEQEQAARRRQEELAAAAASALAEVQDEIDDLCRRRELARQSLLRLGDQIGEVLETVGGIGDLVVLPEQRAAS